MKKTKPWVNPVFAACMKAYGLIPLRVYSRPTAEVHVLVVSDLGEIAEIEESMLMQDQGTKRTLH